MKKIILICLALMTLNGCLKQDEKSNINTEIESKINLIVNDRKIFLADLIYENEIELIKKKYNVDLDSHFSDVSSLKIEGDFGMYTLFGARDKRVIVDSFGDLIVEKWKKLNYDPNYYFHYDKVVKNIHLSTLKMMDFYNSDDMKKYEDSLKVSLINRFLSNEPVLVAFIENEYNFRNRQIWKHQNDSILTLTPLDRKKN